MTTFLIISALATSLTATIAIFAAKIYKQQRDDAKKAQNKAEATTSDVLTAQRELRAEYAAYKESSAAKQADLMARCETVAKNKDDEIATLWEVIDAKLDATTAADLSDAASSLLQARRDGRKAGDVPSPAGTAVPDKPTT